MSDYGLKVFDSSGNCTLDVTDRITRLRYQTTVSADVSDSVVLSDISGLLTFECSIGRTKDYVAHTVSRSGTTISWTAASSFSCDSEIFVFIYT